jgi:uncharacterized protein (DUF2164 family)
MTIELSKTDRADALASLERYFRENMDEPLSSLAAGNLLAFFLEEVGPSIYNKAVQDAQDKLRQRIDDLAYEVSEEEFPYWGKKRRKAGRD